MKHVDPFDFAGRVVLVTGGTRGLGAGTARAFLDAGAQVVVCARGACPDTGGAHLVTADVRDPAQVDRLVRTVLDRFNRLDVVVNNAGGAPYADAAVASPRFHAKVVELNLIAPLHVAQAANTVMQAQDAGGVILMIGSVAGTRPAPGAAAYGAAKAGLHHLATSLAQEWAPKVRVNTVVVGPAATGADDGRADAAAAAAIPLRRPATPADVAGACLFLASPLAAYVSGAELTVHGGGEWPGYLAALRPTAYRAQK